MAEKSDNKVSSKRMPRATGDANAFAPLARRSATIDTIMSIKAQIQSGNIGPGERLPSERELSEALGVSRPTVREAVQALAAMNILDVRHGTGIFVSSLDIGELLTPMRFALELTTPTFDHLFEIRVELEPLAAKLAATRASDEQLAGIQECLARLNARGRTKDERVELDIELHFRIVEASQNELLISVIKSLTVLARRSRELTVAIPGVAARARREHRQLVEAIVSGNPSEARDAMASHLTNVHLLAEEHLRRQTVDSPARSRPAAKTAS